MLTFKQARKRHLAVAEGAARNEVAAIALWNGIIGNGDDLTGYAEAARDTLPGEHAALLARNAVAAAFAFATHAPNMMTKAAPVLLRDAARRNWSTFAERANQTEQLARGFGWDLSEAWEATAQADVAKNGLDQIERIAKLAGRMYQSIRGSNARRVPGIGGEIHSVEQGNNVGRLLASESVLLTDPDLELPLLERISTRRALQYSVRGEDKCARGPIVMLIDESGSMHADRNDWAKAAAVAMARVARDEKRAFVVVHFSTSCVVRKVDPSSATDMGAMISHFLDGGTSIGIAMGVALDEVVALAAEGKRGADMILITDGIDGDAGAIARQVDRAKAANVRLWTVAIECDIYESSPLRKDAAGFTRIGDRQLHDASTVNVLGKAAS